MTVLMTRIKEIETELNNTQPLSAKWYRLQGELAGLYFAMGIMNSEEVKQCIE